MIARFLPDAKDPDHIERAVREVFVQQFGEPLPGEHATQYRDIALEIWRFTAEVRKGAGG